MTQDQWYYAKNDEQSGPIKFAEIQQMAATGQLMPSDLIWTDGMASWLPAGQVQGAFSAAQPPGQPDCPHVHRLEYQDVGESHLPMAIIGFVFSLIFPPIGLILSGVTLSRMKKSGNFKGQVLATAGVIIVAIYMALSCFLWCAFPCLISVLRR